MKHPILKLALAVLAGTSVMLSGCLFENPFDSTGDESGGGGGTQEVSAEAVGQLAVATMGESQAALGSIAPAGAAADNLSVADNSMALGLSKGMKKARSAESMLTEECTIDSTDIANNKITVTCTETTSNQTSTWTATVKADDWETVYALSGSTEYTGGFKDGCTETAVFTDQDGDGIVAAPGLADSKARIVMTASYEKDLPLLGHKAGEVERAVMTATAGPDGDFDTEEDNVVYEASWERKLDGERVAYAEYADADGDGVIIDAAASSPSQVDVVLYEKDPAWEPFVDYNELYFRIITDGNEENDKVIKLYGEQGMITGRVNSIVVLDENGDSIISEGEIAVATFATVVTSNSDSIISSSVSLVFDPVSGLEDDTDNLYYELHYSHEKRLGWVRKLTYDFATDEPVPEGQEPTSGHIEMSVEYANGETASLEADFADGSFSGTYTGPDGTFSVTWNDDGSVAAQEQS
ncbi:MAG: hypothetical protein GF418_12100 [Chitinivibrionales bacterium]|nr:hypothetical protein [Chitinivibrionales bacterium]MBD3396360.1 hypothetical protein [Chitinivibrionales bacterium]